ncbi:hypothetical protein BVRB_8g200400 [Beta vulgaris subsp. vulgaris]|uniref:Protein kinase domain-containing protein n=1 Tax=Beta vulgaris subsp. vulgaris TaxID=3555 RepID=A0A7G2RM17_BETVV|nr:hypothetical protein BVRB_8g200400 [Beta vulgaris subsp. vulgaris]
MQFKTEVSALLMMDPLPSLAYAHGKILVVERHNSVTTVSDSSPKAVGFAVAGKSKGRADGGVEGRHFSSGPSNDRVCSHCGVKGQVKEKCFELHGWPDWYQGRGRGGRSNGCGKSGGRGNFVGNVSSNHSGSGDVTKSYRASTPTLSDTQFATLMAAVNLKHASSSPSSNLHGKMTDNDWIIDTGASNHMSGNINLFFDIHDISSSPMGLPNGKSTTATKEGHVSEQQLNSCRNQGAVQPQNRNQAADNSAQSTSPPVGRRKLPVKQPNNHNQAADQSATQPVGMVVMVRADFLEEEGRSSSTSTSSAISSPRKSRRRNRRRFIRRTTMKANFTDNKMSMATVVKTLSLRTAARGKKKQQQMLESVAGHKSSAQTFTFRQMANATNNFSIENLVGEGGFGRVYKGYIPGVEKVVAVKQLDRNGQQGNREFLSEVFMLSLVDHPNLVNLIGYCADGDQRILVYEFMANGSVEDHLLDLPPNKEPLDWHTRMKIAEGAAKGLEYLHETNKPQVIYRDFKASNILLDEEFNSKLSDFGLARIGPTGDKEHVSTRVMGTYGYCAPEYAMTGQLTTKSDVYSFGVVFLELISGRRAVDTTKPTAEQNLVSWAEPLFKDRKMFTKMADPLMADKYPVKGLYQALAVAAMCLQEEASTRPLISDVVTALEFLAKPEDDLGSPRSDSIIIRAVEAEDIEGEQEEHHEEEAEDKKEEHQHGYVVQLGTSPDHMI